MNNDNDMEYKIIRLDSTHADIISPDKKDYTFFLKTPMILEEEYHLQVGELLIKTTYPIGGLRTVFAPLLEDIFISSPNNDWGFSSLGTYYYYDQSRLQTLIFEIRTNTTTQLREAVLTGLTINYAFNNDGRFSIFHLPSPPFYEVEAGTLTHQTLGTSFVWQKTTDFTTNRSQLRVLTEPQPPLRKYRVRIDNIQHLPCDYINSNKKYEPVIVDLAHLRRTPERTKEENKLLTLRPQVICNIKISVEDIDSSAGLDIEGDILNMCLILSKKKYIDII